LKTGAAERLRIAMLSIDYVIRFELLFLLVLRRTPQLIVELQIGQKNALFTAD
jgi:hypothetical protein